MKAFILHILLLTAAVSSYGQRYRVVVDTTLEFNKEESQYSVKNVTHYIYKPGLERGSNYNNDTINYDTAYYYVLRKDSLHLETIMVNTYDENDNKISHSTYEKALQEDQLYFTDTLTYKKQRLVREVRYRRPRNVPTGQFIKVNDTLPLIEIIGSSNLMMFSNKEYAYKNGLLTEIKLYDSDSAYPSFQRKIWYNKKGKEKSYVTYHYKDDQLVKTDTMTYFYKDDFFIGWYEEQYLDGDTAWSKKIRRNNKSGKEISDSTFAKWKNKGDSSLTVRHKYYYPNGLDSFIVYKIYTDKEFPKEYRWHDSYTTYGYIYESKLEEVSYYRDKKYVSVTLSRYTYEQY